MQIEFVFPHNTLHVQVSFLRCRLAQVVTRSPALAWIRLQDCFVSGQTGSQLAMEIGPYSKEAIFQLSLSWTELDFQGPEKSQERSNWS